MEDMARSHPVVRVFLTMSEDVNTPRSLSGAILARYGEWVQLLNRSFPPSDYLDASEYYLDTVCCDFLRKSQFTVPGIDRTQAATVKAVDSEHQCFRTNLRLSRFRQNLASSQTDNDLYPIIDGIRSRIARVLGKIPDDINGRFGPGATVFDRGNRANLLYKLSHLPETSTDAKRYLALLEGSAWFRPYYANYAIPVVDYDQFLTVPKTAITDRGICIGPSGNTWLQLGVGNHIRHRLLTRAGIDLDYGQEKHRRLAQKASLDDSLATIDLSSASDTVATECVRLLFPEDWYELLDDLRLKRTRGLNTSGSSKSLTLVEKFSAMGNGFTFELETLIFKCIADTVASAMGCSVYDVSVYGDDIIVPKVMAVTLVSALKFFGFTTNAKKTYLEGSFRESCGGDYFLGEPVRAYFVKELPNEPADWIALANGIRSIWKNRPKTGTRSYLESNRRFGRSMFYRAWSMVLSSIPVAVRRLRGPEELGDLCIHDDESRWLVKSSNSIRKVRVWKRRDVRISLEPESYWGHKPHIVFAMALLSGGDREIINGAHRMSYTPRGARYSYKIGWVCFS